MVSELWAARPSCVAIVALRYVNHATIHRKATYTCSTPFHARNLNQKRVRSARKRVSTREKSETI